VYDLGEFELTFQVDKIPIAGEGLQTALRECLQTFAADFSASAQQPIHIPKPPDQ
jgi:hypothetical protein